jgi:hypothetical protein
VNCWVAPVNRDADVGLIDIVLFGGEDTVTIAAADLVTSTTLVAVTVYVPTELGAVYKPDVETVPPVADHVTAVLLLPLTEAENC